MTARSWKKRNDSTVVAGKLVILAQLFCLSFIFLLSLPLSLSLSVSRFRYRGSCRCKSSSDIRNGMAGKPILFASTYYSLESIGFSRSSYMVTCTASMFHADSTLIYICVYYCSSCRGRSVQRILMKEITVILVPVKETRSMTLHCDSLFYFFIFIHSLSNKSSFISIHIPFGVPRLQSDGSGLSERYFKDSSLFIIFRFRLPWCSIVPCISFLKRIDTA